MWEILGSGHFAQCALGSKTEVHLGAGIYLVSTWLSVREFWLPSSSPVLLALESVWAGERVFIWFSSSLRASGLAFLIFKNITFNIRRPFI